jgi:hypothetical protein
MLKFISENFEMILRGLAAFLVGVVAGGVHAIWSLHTYVPILSALTRNAREKIGRHRPAPPPKKSDFKWLLTSLFGFGAAGVVAASLLDGKRGIALYFIGLFLGLVPSIGVIVLALIGLVWLVFNPVS